LKVAVELLKILAEEGRFLMARGHIAPLSPNEEVSLRRVALGISKTANLPARDIARLKALSLIEEHGAGLRRTPVGRERYLALPNSGAIYESDTPDEFISQMAEFMSKARS
jgi:hypothetical protein